MIHRLPFYTIFDALRRNGFPLGIAEYKAFLEVLSGYNQYLPLQTLIGKTQLFEICKTLWLKPNQVPLVFETIFNEQYDRLFTPGDEINLPPAAGTADDKAAGGGKQDEQMPLPLQGEQKPEDGEDKSQRSAEEYKTDRTRGVRLVLGANRGEYQYFKKEKIVESDRRFLFSDNYFPVTLREMQQLFSSLPEKKQQRAGTEIDIDATIDSISRNGYLIETAYKKKEEILNNLIILHDHKGSMVAFEKLSEMLTQVGRTIFTNLKERNVPDSVYYFQNATEKHIYLNKANTIFREMDTFIDLLKEKKVMLIIMSDAGAARGSNSDIRVRLNIRMLVRLQKITSRIVWLNPMPEQRWKNTSAERIAEFVPMYPIDSRGLRQAVAILRGKQIKIN